MVRSVLLVVYRNRSPVQNQKLLNDESHPEDEGDKLEDLWE